MRFCSFAATSILVGAGLAAHADTFAFSFGDATDVFSGSGMLAATQEAPQEYLITAVSGMVQTTANGPEVDIQSILPSGVFPTEANGGTFPPNDNTMFFTNGAGHFSQDGLSFLLMNGAQINLYFDGPGDDAFLDRANGQTLFENAPITITAAAPEPSSIALLGTGLLGMAGIARRRLTSLRSTP